MVCTELFDLTDIKLIAIAREKVEYIIAGESHIDQKCKYDQSVTLRMPKETFKSRTEVKLLVREICVWFETDDYLLGTPFYTRAIQFRCNRADKKRKHAFTS